MLEDTSYFSIDLEASGPAPGLSSMLSIGIAVFEHGQLTGTFSRNLEELPNAGRDPETMKWWATQPLAWELCRKDPEDPQKVMSECAEFIDSFPGKKVAVGWPVAFDFGFLNWYFWNFCGRNPLGYSGLDLRSYVAGLNRHPGYLGIPESEINSLAEKAMPVWLRKELVAHEAASDALEQGFLLVAALEFARKAGGGEVGIRS
jgi:hypothetical protein